MSGEVSGGDKTESNGTLLTTSGTGGGTDGGGRDLSNVE